MASLMEDEQSLSAVGSVGPGRRSIDAAVERLVASTTNLGAANSQTTKVSRGQRLLKKGAQMARDGDFNSAVRQYTRALTLEPGLYVVRLRVRWRRSCKSTTNNGSCAQAYACRAVAHTLLSNHSAAISDFSKALMHKPMYVQLPP